MVTANINDLALAERWAIRLALPPPGICGVHERETSLYFLPLLECASLSLRAARDQPAGWERAVPFWEPDYQEIAPIKGLGEQAGWSVVMGCPE